MALTLVERAGGAQDIELLGQEKRPTAARDLSAKRLTCTGPGRGLAARHDSLIPPEAHSQRPRLSPEPPACFLSPDLAARGRSPDRMLHGTVSVHQRETMNVNNVQSRTHCLVHAHSVQRSHQASPSSPSISSLLGMNFYDPPSPCDSYVVPGCYGSLYLQPNHQVPCREISLISRSWDYCLDKRRGEGFLLCGRCWEFNQNNVVLGSSNCGSVLA